MRICLSFKFKDYVDLSVELCTQPSSSGRTMVSFTTIEFVFKHEVLLSYSFIEASSLWILH